MEELAIYLPSLYQGESDWDEYIIPDTDYLSSGSESSLDEGSSSVEDDDMETLKDASELLESAMKLILKSFVNSDKAADKITDKMRIMTGKLTGIRGRYKVTMDWVQVVEKQMKEMGEEIRKLKRQIGELEKPEDGEEEEEPHQLPPVMKWNPGTMSWTASAEPGDGGQGQGQGNGEEEALDLSNKSTLVASSVHIGSISNSRIRKAMAQVVAKSKKNQKHVGESSLEEDGEAELESDTGNNSHWKNPEEDTELCEEEEQSQAEDGDLDESGAENTSHSEDEEGDDSSEPDQDDSYTYVPPIPISPVSSKSSRPTRTRKRASKYPPAAVPAPLETNGKSTKRRSDKRSSGRKAIKTASVGASSGAKPKVIRRRGPGKKPRQVAPFYCPICNKEFGWKHGLKGHMQLHNPHREKTVKCSICSKAFYDGGDLRQHMVSHMEKSIPCPVCQKVFKTNYAINLHMKVHTNVRPFQCPDCGKRFKRRPDLKEHREIHTGKKPYSCSICQRRFLRTVHLRAHMLTHGGEKKFKCEVCRASFLKKSNMERHISQVHFI